MLFEQFGTAMLLVFVAVLAFGWVEDIAARRRPQLIPGASGSVAMINTVAGMLAQTG